MQENLQQIKNSDEEFLISLRVDPNYDQPVLHQVLRIAVYDEYHAYETYKKVIEKFGAVEPFSNIIQAEIRHYEALLPLLQKYEVPVPLNDWEGKIEAPDSLLEASEIGVAAEIDNIKMYDNLILYAKEYPDVLDTLYRLQAASYNNHLPAFRQSVAKHSHNAMPMDINTIYEQFSTHNQTPNGDDMMGKMNEFNEIASKFASGQATQEDLMKVLGNTNLSFVGGALLGAMGTMVLTQVMEGSSTKKETQEDETEKESCQ